MCSCQSRRKPTQISRHILGRQCQEGRSTRTDHHRTFPIRGICIRANTSVSTNSHSPEWARWCSGKTQHSNPPRGNPSKRREFVTGCDEVPGSSPGIGEKSPPSSEAIGRSPPRPRPLRRKNHRVFRSHRPSHRGKLGGELFALSHSTITTQSWSFVPSGLHQGIQPRQAPSSGKILTISKHTHHYPTSSSFLPFFSLVHLSSHVFPHFHLNNAYASHLPLSLH